MAERPVQLYNVQYRRLFPWLHLARAFWIAADFRKLLLAAAALMLVSLGSLACDQLPFGMASSDEESAALDGGRWPWQWPLGYDLWHGGDGLAELRGGLRDPRNLIFRAASNWQIVLLPFREFIEPAARLFRADATWPQLADAATRSLWNLVVWSLFGGAITRIAAVQFARDQQIGILRALAFSGARFPGYLSAPVMPLFAVAIFWALCVIGGWIGRLPGGAGEAILGVFWGLELLFGFLMAVVLLGAGIGWPLMFATISVEGTDGFDGLSRAYNYVFERPLYLLWQLIVTMLYGSLMIFFVWLMAQLLTQLAVWGVSWGLGYEAVAGLLGLPQEPAVPGPYADAASAWGAGIARGWMHALSLLVVAFVHTFFWSSATIIYFVLRHSIDANDFDEVYVENAEEKDELLPLVGTAAMGEAAQQAPAAGPDSQSVPPVDLTP
jgi:hypothetical protein